MSLSIVFGTPTIGMPRLWNSWAIASVPSPPMTTSASRPSLWNISTTAVGVVDACRRLVSTGYANGLPRLVVPRIVPPIRRMPVTSLGVSDARAVRLDQAVEAVLEAEHSMPELVRRLDDGADDGVQAGRIAAAGEHADAFRQVSSVFEYSLSVALRRWKPHGKMELTSSVGG